MMKRTDWSSIVSGKDLATVKSSRKKVYVSQKILASDLPKYVDNGWGKIPVLYDKNGKGIYSGDKIKGLFIYGSDIIGECAYSSKDAAWGIRWMRGEVEEFTPFCACCNVEWEVVGE